MRKVLSIALISAGLVSLVNADTFNLHKGWNLVGSSSSVDVSKDFNNSNVAIVWRYENGKWQYFTTNEIIKTKVGKKYTFFTKTSPNEGFWVYTYNPVTINVGNKEKEGNYQQSNNSNNQSLNDLYPNKTYLGKMWGYEWYKIYGGDVKLDNQFNDIDITAYKVDNQDSRAGAIAVVYDASKLEADINLIKDGKYADFTMSGIGKVDGDKAIIVSLDFYKNKIIAWWDTIYPNGNWDDHTILVQNYNEDLTNLTSTSDVKAIIENNNGIFNLKVINLENNETIFDTNLSLADTNLTGFKGFDLVRFRSRVKDNVANQNGEEAIDESENIVNQFVANSNNKSDVKYGNMTLDKFKNMLSQKSLNVIDYNLSGKTIAGAENDGDEYDIVYFNNSFYQHYGYNQESFKLEDSGKVNYTINDGIYVGNNGSYAAIVSKIQDVITVVGYDPEGGFWQEKFLVLNGDAINTKITSSNIKNFFPDTDFVNITDSDIEGTWISDDDEKIVFNNGQFSFTWLKNGEDDGEGTYKINNGVIELDWNDGSAISYVLPVELNNNQLKVYVIQTDVNGNLRGAEIHTLTKQ